MPDSETIDVQFALMDKDALTNFTEAITQANTLLAQAQTGMRGSQPTETGGSGGALDAASRSSADTGINRSGSGGASTSSGLVDHLNDPGRVTNFLGSMATNTPMGATDDGKTPLTSRLGSALSNPLTRPIAQSAYKASTSGSISEGLTFAIANHISPAIMQSNTAALGLNALNPFSASAQGQAQGLPAGGGTLNIPTPVGNFPIQSPFGPAYATTLSNTWQALTQGFSTAGVSAGDVKGIQDNLAAAGLGQALNIGGFQTALPSSQGGTGVVGPIGPGTTQSDFNTLEGALRRIITPTDAGGIGVPKGIDKGAMAEESLNMIRDGQASTRDILDSFSGISESARSANMSLNDFVKAVGSTAEQLQTIGPLTQAQAWQSVRAFSDATHMPPQVMSQMMQNPYVQAQMTYQTGLPSQLLPQAVSANPSLLTNSIQQSSNMFKQAYSGMFPTQTTHHGGKHGYDTVLTHSDQVDSMIASSMNMSLGQYRNMQQHQKQIAAQSNMEGMTKTMGDEIAKIQKGPGQNTAAVNRLFSGTSTKGTDIQDLIHAAQQPGSGISAADIRKIQDNSDNPAQKMRDLNKLIASSRPGRLPSNNTNKTYVGFTGYAEKVLRQVMSGSNDPVFQSMNKQAKQGKGANTAAYLNDKTPNATKYLDQQNKTGQNVPDAQAQAQPDTGLPPSDR